MLKGTVDKFLVIAALVLTGAFAWSLVRPVGIPPPNAILTQIDTALYTGDLVGSATAKQKLVVFSDYECEACRRHAASLDTLVRQSNAFVGVIYRHFPAPQNRAAEQAALAAVCAGEQKQFAKYHESIFQMQDTLSSVDWVWMAHLSGIQDSVRFRECLKDSLTANRLYRDIGSGMALRLDGTPATVIGNRLYVGAMPTKDMQLAIAQTQRRQFVP